MPIKTDDFDLVWTSINWMALGHSQPRSTHVDWALAHWLWRIRSEKCAEESSLQRIAAIEQSDELRAGPADKTNDDHAAMGFDRLLSEVSEQALIPQVQVETLGQVNVFLPSRLANSGIYVALVSYSMGKSLVLGIQSNGSASIIFSPVIGETMILNDRLEGLFRNLSVRLDGATVGQFLLWQAVPASSLVAPNEVGGEPGAYASYLQKISSSARSRLLFPELNQ